MFYIILFYSINIGDVKRSLRTHIRMMIHSNYLVHEFGNRSINKIVIKYCTNGCVDEL